MNVKASLSIDDLRDIAENTFTADDDTMTQLASLLDIGRWNEVVLRLTPTYAGFHSSALITITFTAVDSMGRKLDRRGAG